MVNYRDIPERVQIIGKLGHPLGELVTVRGKWMTFNAKPAPPVFVVDQVNGKRIDPPGRFEKVQPVSGGLDDLVHANGEEWELRGVETGGFVGFGKNVYDELGEPTMQRLPSGFLTQLYYVRAKRLITGNGPAVGKVYGKEQKRNIATTPAVGAAMQESKVKMVNYRDIPERVQIVGKLGHPLGELVTVRGWWTTLLLKPKPPVFVVDQVNGKRIDPPAEFDRVQPVSEGSDGPVHAVGEEWELRGVETGGFIGFGKNVYDELGEPATQKSPGGFFTRFCFVRATRVSVGHKSAVGNVPLSDKQRQGKETPSERENPFGP
jgi:hypothetical protein